MNFENKEDLLAFSKSIIGKKISFYDFDNELNTNKNKGVIGQIIEKHFFEKKLDSSKEADLKLLNGDKVELKVTPVKQNKDESYVAKERLVLSIIDYMNIQHSDFLDSELYTKIEHTLLICYLWNNYDKIGDYKFINTYFLKISSTDLEIIKRDYSIIIGKIKLGLAHEISESDTMYLSACTKGASAKSLRTQINSDIMAKQRAYSFKNSFMTNQLNNNQQDSLTLGSDPRKSICSIINKYRGIEIKDIVKENKLSEDILKTKQKRFMIVNEILTINNIDSVVKKANISIKTINLSKKIDSSFTLRESMKLYNIKIEDISKEYSSSMFYDHLEQSIYLFVFFYEDKIYNAKIHNFSAREKKELEKVWNITHELYTNGIGESKLPKSNDNEISHIRPGAKNKEDRYLTPGGDYITKQAIWLNRKYILTLL